MHCPAKMDFFPSFSSLCNNVKEGGGRQCTSLYSTYLVVFDKFVFMAGGRFYGQVVFIFFCIDAPFRFTTTVGLLEEHQRVENQDGYIFY